MKKQEHYIYLGRFQPPHNDHVVAIVDALEKSCDPFFIGLIISDNQHLPDDGHVTAFEKEARMQNSQEKTPFSFYQCLEFIEHSLINYLRKYFDIYVLSRSLDQSLHVVGWIYAAFPGNRNWIIPDCGEDFDEINVQFF